MAVKFNSSGGGSVTLDAPSTASNLTVTLPSASGTLATTDGTNTTFTSITDSGNLTFTGTGNRITGDFSNATLANRVSFQTSTANSTTSVFILPSGTGTTGQLAVFNNSDPTNAANANITVNTTESSFRAGTVGTGAALPMTLYTGGSERMRIDTSGQVGVGTTSPRVKLEVGAAINAPTALATAVTTGANGNFILSDNGGGTVGSQFGIALNGSSYDTYIQARNMGAASTAYNLLLQPLGGNVGIGTSSPPAKLAIHAADTTPQLNLYGSSTGSLGANLTYKSASGDLYIATNGVNSSSAPQMVLSASGNVGIGTSSPVSNGGYGGLTLNGTNGSIFSLSTAGTEGARLYNGGNETSLQCKASTGYITFVQGLSGGTERMRIDSSGNVLIGTTNTTLGSIGIQLIKSGQIQVTKDAATALYLKRGSNPGPVAEFIAENGASVGYIAVSTGGTTYNTSSDYRLKENIQPMTGALEKVAQLNPVTYTWKADGSDGQGFIAHELQAVVPDCVTGEKDAVDEEGKPVYQGIDTSFLVATLTKAIQELEARVKQLEGAAE